MPDFDIYNDKAPFRRGNPFGRPTVAQLKAALTAFNATSYTAARLATMSKHDLVYACRLHNLTVNTTLA